MPETELISGLEIHQQLNTKKLFCSCPSVLRKDSPDYTIERELYAVAGETGEIDTAVKYEAKKNKRFFYQGYYDNNCLVELDEEPPHQINNKALNIALQISLFFNCEIIPYTQIMRKTVIDGSNVSGFQRTVLIAKNGYIKTKQGRVRISSIALEEDAARIVSNKKGKTTYKLDRLGIPLVEITTCPDIKTKEQAKETALHIGEILRACDVKRGIGTIRQDVNMSIQIDNKFSERIEIKGVQEPELIEKTIEIEIERQKKLLKENKSIPEVRKALPNGQTKFLRPLPGKARMYPETDLQLLHITRDMINKAKKELPKLKSEIKKELKNKGLNEELIKVLIKYRKIQEFQELLEVYNKPELIAKILTVWISDIAKKNKKTIQQIEKKLTLDIIETILQAVQKKEISENEIYEVMEDIIKGKEIKEALKKEKLENLEEEILKIVREKPNLSTNAYMGLVMQKFKGKVNGKEVVEILKRVIEN
ncbi:MAG: Glu-tRNA(Gln) amidotransferase subunit GatE [Nanoarchaeota archaeon]|nr:Glu-tRNA(Gln) amidotransferase subunit GatE [Nanoarchaeota archaeon]